MSWLEDVNRTATSTKKEERGNTNDTVTLTLCPMFSQLNNITSGSDSHILSVLGWDIYYLDQTTVATVDISMLGL